MEASGTASPNPNALPRAWWHRRCRRHAHRSLTEVTSFFKRSCGHWWPCPCRRCGACVVLQVACKKLCAFCHKVDVEPDCKPSQIPCSTHLHTSRIVARVAVIVKALNRPLGFAVQSIDVPILVGDLSRSLAARSQVERQKQKEALRSALFMFCSVLLPLLWAKPPRVSS